MVTIKCQHSGIEFEAATRRTKMHPLIAKAKAQASKDNLYREFNQAIDTVAKQGGYTTIEEYMTQVKAIMSGEKQAQTERINARLRQEAERKSEKEEARKRREEQNRILKQHGYTWHVEYVERDAPALEMRDEGKYFYLTDPDGNEISVTQALDEIKRGRDVVRAEKQAEAVEAEKRQAEKEAVRKAELTEYNNFRSQVDTIRAENVEVEANDLPEDVEIIAKNKQNRIWKYNKNGITCYKTLTGVMYDDDGRYGYYCADPIAANLSPVDVDDTHQLFRDIFG